MVERDLIIKEKVQHEGLFNFKELYKYAHQWFREEDYDAVIEEKYKEKLVTGNARDIEVEWKISKSLSEYFKMEMSVKFEILGMSDVEAEIDGKKKKMNKGEIGVEIKGFVTKDPKSKWEIYPFYRFIREVYDKYVIPSRTSAIEDRLKDDVRDFKEALKSFLELYGRRV